MSPPCQPFTRNGNFKDVDDNRADPLNHLCKLLPKLTSIEYILLENVVGFDKSKARINFIAALKESGYHYQELILTPTLLGTPNSRNRYYCIARKGDKFSFEAPEIVSK